jgi:hypothetical protein
VSDQIFKEYDECGICQSFDMKPANVPAMEKHLFGVHSQKGVALYVCSRKTGFRTVFLELYNLTKPYHEPNFDRDLKLDFYAKCWEMLTCRALLNSNIAVSANTTQAGADYDTELGYVECINVEPEKGYVPQATKPGVVVMLEVPEIAIQLRITNGFDKKSQAFKRYIDKGVINATKPRIIAINYARAHEMAWTDDNELSDNYVLRSLFGMGPQQVVIGPGHESQEFKVSFQPVITKGENIEVPSDYFLTDKHKHISAVIYSNHHINSDKSFDISIVNNPYAEIPVSLDNFSAMNRIIADIKASTLSRNPRVNLDMVP